MEERPIRDNTVSRTRRKRLAVQIPPDQLQIIQAEARIRGRLVEELLTSTLEIEVRLLAAKEKG